MSILKVEVGKPVTLTVAKARVAEGKFGPQIAFDSTNGDTLFVGEETAIRQLTRIGYDAPADTEGATLFFEKVQNNGKTYLNIKSGDRAGTQASGAKASNGGGVGQKREGAAIASPQLPASSALAPLYMECLSAAKTAIAAAGLKGVTAADVIAATATLFIQATREGRPVREAVAAPRAAAPKKDAVRRVPEYGEPALEEFEEFPQSLEEAHDNLPF